jgi:hypothetical protein
MHNKNYLCCILVALVIAGSDLHGVFAAVQVCPVYIDIEIPGIGQAVAIRTN